ncbi:asparagine synthase (glutamine-hydrolyzing) [Turneriella parva]|uniref:asparagine synthase (glutamine-hydrolyzing) n=1 Tax=Turneriella parva (strain ATCC BAA-1111 / DSM 21527 / NCTC 11395 / H) TaxID=869212 RepID=I4B120_TURPD|nr:asparagine synthase (glutamine-hydrolyzing) [Turneriella parva]AFM10977.1 asparagine synthase (glutamine-hydrolyzing) [Turneriella parva DSM 21527]
MCSIAGIVSIDPSIRIPALERRLSVINDLLRHRGPDGQGIWVNPRENVGLAHTRLSIIDLETGQQPMHTENGFSITFNGEIYNFPELRQELGADKFRTHSDTEVLLRAYEKWGAGCLDRLRGMFAFAIWDHNRQELFCARDRFGIKPFYYTIVEGKMYFASEAKALLPFLPSLEADAHGLKDYLTFQFCLDSKTLFKDVQILQPAHSLTVRNGQLLIHKYWEVYYHIDFDHTAHYFAERTKELLHESIKLHCRSDVPVGAYVSGGVDSTSIAAIAVGLGGVSPDFKGFTGKFAGYGAEFDESQYARDACNQFGIELHEIDIDYMDFSDNFRNIIYHLDSPVAGPGSFPQYMVSALAAKHRKVVLGGQGGDEIFGGYVRYLIGYFEQCIKGAIDGTLSQGNFVVTYESIIPNLVNLRNYKPMLKEFFSQGMFDSLDKRYYHLINRAPTLKDEIQWSELGEYSPFESFQRVFLSSNVQKEAYFDSMTHFDFKTLLPALLQVEDRMSMAHGLESRVPLLDHKLVELAATIPADIKFKDGTLKRIYSMAVDEYLPPSIKNRKNKMGFPVPINRWFANELNSYVKDIFSEQKARQRSLFNSDLILQNLQNESQFSRKLWGLLSLEVWHQEFIDKAPEYRKLVSGLS